MKNKSQWIGLGVAVGAGVGAALGAATHQMPRQGGEEPLMSKVSPVPCLVIFILISSGSSTTPSESTIA